MIERLKEQYLELFAEFKDCLDLQEMEILENRLSKLTDKLERLMSEDDELLEFLNTVPGRTEFYRARNDAIWRPSAADRQRHQEVIDYLEENK